MGWRYRWWLKSVLQPSSYTQVSKTSFELIHLLKTLTMPKHLLSLPTELLDQVLSALPIPSLLAFSSTSQHARILARNNLHSLSLGIAPLHSSSFSTSPYDIWLRIPNANSYPYLTLLNFQSALVSSTLTRHGSMLQHLELSVWALTVPIAEAIANLAALQSLSIRIESGGYARRSCKSFEREKQHKAWTLLSSEKCVWRSRLMALRIEDADLGTEQLAGILGGATRCRELWLNRCWFIGKEVWGWLGGDWKGRDVLRILDVSDCGGVLGEEAVDAIGRLKGLQVSPPIVFGWYEDRRWRWQYLNLYDCQTLDSGVFERCDRDVWHIPEFIGPRTLENVEDMIIEVDPEYR
jgi:hypothetical protein